MQLDKAPGFPTPSFPFRKSWVTQITDYLSNPVFTFMPCNSHSYVVNLPTKQALKTLSSPPSIPVKAEPQLIPFHASSFSLYLGPYWVAPGVSCVLLDLTVINPFLPPNFPDVFFAVHLAVIVTTKVGPVTTLTLGGEMSLGPHHK